MKIVFAGASSQVIPGLRDKIGEGMLQYLSGAAAVTVEVSSDNATWNAVGIVKCIDETVVASVSAAGAYKFRPGSWPYTRITSAGVATVWASIEPL
jgi:hypothetical protein